MKGCEAGDLDGTHPDIGMGGHLEGFWGCEGLAWKDPQVN